MICRRTTGEWEVQGGGTIKEECLERNNQKVFFYIKQFINILKRGFDTTIKLLKKECGFTL